MNLRSVTVVVSRRGGPAVVLNARFQKIVLLAAGVSICLGVRVGLAAGVPSSPYLGYVYKYADTMLQKGRDTYGPQKTGLVLSALDRTTLAPLTTRPAAPGGIRRGDRVGLPWLELVGANPQLDENFLRLLYVLRGLSSQAKYSDAADQEIKFFLEHAASPETGLLSWGEHMFWNVMTDEPDPKTSDAVHEFSRPWMLWDKCYELAPQASRKFALALWEHQIADHKTGAYDRHAPYWKHGPKNGMDFPRHGGFYIRTWAEAYAHTGEDVFLKAIETLLARFERRRDGRTGLMDTITGSPKLGPELSLAIDCDGASRKVPEPLASRLKKFADREDELFCALPHNLKETKGFVMTVDKASGKPAEEHTGLWDAHYGGSPTAMVAMMCVSRYENTGKIGYRDLITAAADAYLNSVPGEDEDAWPMTFGHAISLELAAWRSTARREYLDRARELGLLAIQLFFQDNPLPRASLKTGHYESITGADTLALALTELHLTSLTITVVRVPDNTIDR
jgi:hypothetical protein